MSYIEFSKDLKDNNIKNICILWGRELFLSEWAQREIVNKYSNGISEQFDIIEFNGEECDLMQVAEACETLPLFSSKKIVIVNHLPLLEGKTSVSDNEDTLLAYIKNPSATTLLIFVCGEKVDKRRGVYKAAVKNASIYEFGSLSQSELSAWIRKRFKQMGKIINPPELNLIISLSGYYDRESDYSLYHFENDISKVILHSESDVISTSDIENTVSGNINTNVFMMIDYIGEGDKRKAFNMLNDMLLYGQNEYGILALLFRQYENILNVKQLATEGRTKTQIADVLNSKEFIVNKWMTLSRKYSEESLRSVLKQIYQADKLIKSGDVESRMILEVLIASI